MQHIYVILLNYAIKYLLLFKFSQYTVLLPEIEVTFTIFFILTLLTGNNCTSFSRQSTSQCYHVKSEFTHTQSLMKVS